MATFERGPLAFGPMPLAPDVMRPDTFQSLGRQLIEAHGAFDAVINERLRQLGTAGAADLDAEYDRDVGPAYRDLDGLSGGTNPDQPLGIVKVVDEQIAQLAAVVADLPDPNAPDPDISTESQLPPGDPRRDITIGSPAPPAAPLPPAVAIELIGPGEIDQLAVQWFVAVAGRTPTPAELARLADAAGYVDGAFVRRDWLMAFLNSPAARAAAGI